MNNQSDYPTYDICTIPELFDIINGENIERFLKDFDLTMRIYVDLKEKYPNIFTQKKFTWIDDGINEVTTTISYTKEL